MARPISQYITRERQAAITALGVLALLAFDIAFSSKGWDSQLHPVSHLPLSVGIILWGWLLLPNRESGQPNPLLLILTNLTVVGVLLLETITALDGRSTNAAYVMAPHALFLVLTGALCALTLVRCLRTQALVLHDVTLGGAALVWWAATVTVDLTGWPNLWRGTEFYVVAAFAFALTLQMIAVAWHRRTTRMQLVTTTTTGVYLVLATVISALVALAPGHLTPLPGPLVLIPVGIALDLFHRWLARTTSPARQTLRLGFAAVAIVLALLAAHWHLAALLISPDGVGHDLANPWWRGQVDAYESRYRFWTVPTGTTAQLRGIATAVASAGVGLFAGHILGKKISTLPSIPIGADRS